MATKLFVGGLAYAMDSDELREVFAGVGNVVSAQVIMDRESGRSKGFGFVEMETEEEAKKAIDQLSDTEVHGRRIVVSEARPQEKREPRRFDNNRGDRRY